MKKFTFIIFFLGIQMLIFGQEIMLQNIVEGKFRAKNIKPLVSSSNGDFYYQSNEDNTQILKYAYSSGLVKDTLLDLKKIKGRSSIDTFQGFLISPSENKILIFDGVENIYRRSFRANYYVYNIELLIYLNCQIPNLNKWFRCFLQMEIYWLMSRIIIFIYTI